MSHDSDPETTFVPGCVGGEEEPDFRVGETIDRQFHVDRIARGGMSVVYFVTDRTTQRQYVLKALSAEKLNGEPTAVARFQQEALVWVNLEYHPHIVQALTFLGRPKRPMLMLEFIDGCSLFEFLRDNNVLSPYQAVRWGQQLCEAMQYVHTKPFPNGDIGTLHRDIKPGNILLTRFCTAKLTDFGLAKLNSGYARSQAGDFAGTPAYSSPEQIRSSTDIGPTSDIFAFGAVLYEMLTGRRAFVGKSLLETVDAVRRCQPDFSRIPLELEPVLRRCLAPLAENRWESFSALSQALNETLTELPQTTVHECQTCSYLSHTNTPCPICGGDRLDETAVEGVGPAVGPPVASRQAHMIEFCQCKLPQQLHLKYCSMCGLEHERIHCLHCGVWNRAGNTFCTNCGETLTKH